MVLSPEATGLILHNDRTHNRPPGPRATYTYTYNLSIYYLLALLLRILVNLYKNSEKPIPNRRLVHLKFLHYNIKISLHIQNFPACFRMKGQPTTFGLIPYKI